MRLIAIDDLKLVSGAGRGQEDRFCVMEAASVYDPKSRALKVNGVTITDQPKSVSPVIGAFLRRWNDGMNDTDRQILKPLIGRVIGTNTGHVDDQVRAYLAVDWCVHIFAPTWLTKAGLTAEAQQLRDLPTIDSRRAAESAHAVIVKVREASRAKRDLAWKKLYADAAAYDAADDASYAAASDADAAAYAAYTAADAAAYTAAAAAAYAAYAAYAAAYDADDADKNQLKGMTFEQKKAWFRKRIDEANAETIHELQVSALDLVERMIAVGKTA